LLGLLGYLRLWSWFSSINMGHITVLLLCEPILWCYCHPGKGIFRSSITFCIEHKAF
jgi:hypothetical protein